MVERWTGSMPRSPRTRVLSSIEVGSTNRASTSWKNASSRIWSNPSADHAAWTTSTSSVELLPVTIAGCVTAVTPKSSMSWPRAASFSRPTAINAASSASS